MVLIHHLTLGVNSEVPAETLDIWSEHGWESGLHPDSDPDDDSRVPRVVPVPEPAVPEPTSRTAKKD